MMTWLTGGTTGRPARQANNGRKAAAAALGLTGLCHGHSIGAPPVKRG